MTDPELAVAARALAAIAAHAAAESPGVVRLQPYALIAARSAATAAARRVGATLTGQDDPPDTASVTGADPDAVDVDRRDDGTVLVGVRIVAGTEPSVRDIAQGVARNVADRLRELADVRATVTVHVVDVDPDAARP